jgi:hypothetical protein
MPWVEGGLWEARPAVAGEVLNPVVAASSEIVAGLETETATAVLHIVPS